jgi:hypothetical protein
MICNEISAALLQDYNMRAKEFLNEVTLDIPDQMITVQIPLTAVSKSSDTPINPGKRAGDTGQYKWSPPLQQHLDTAKDAVGPSNSEIDVDSSNAIEAKRDAVEELRSKIAAILMKTPSVLG